MGVVRLFVVVLAAISWLCGSPTAAHADPDDADVWEDTGALAKHLDAACQAVERACGGPFWHRLNLRVSSQEEVMRTLGGLPQGERGVLEYAPDESQRLLAYYDPIRFTVHILPDELRRVANLCSVPGLLHEDVLRVILVHEATHALDFQRFPMRWTLACCSAADERLATEAVLEGHAQLVAEHVAKTWGIEDAFRCLTSLYTGGGSDFGEGTPLGYDQEASFTYVQGHAFMREVQRVRGQAGVEAALRDPPTETRVIDRPELWLKPELRGKEHDLQALLEVFRPFVPPGEWDLGKWRILGPSPAPGAASHGGFLEHYWDNHGLFVGSPSGNSYLNVFIAHCKTAGDAERFVRALRGVDVSRDSTGEWMRAERRDGAGPSGKLPGFTSLRRAVGGAPESELTMQVARQGHHVVEVSTYGLPGTPQGAWDRALDVVARMLYAPPPGEVAVALQGNILLFIGARASGDMERARERMRDLLPSEADLRRVVRPGYAEAFAAGYEGVRLALRNARVPNATVDSAFSEARRGTEVQVWAATTEQLAAGTVSSPHFPPEMQHFARHVAAPGMTWLVLHLRPRGQEEPNAYACFARLGDRFLWIKDPWTVVR